MNLYNKIMPNDPYSIKVMDERAELLAHETVDRVTVDKALVNYIQFKLGSNELYGIPFKQIRDVTRVQQITTVPMTPRFVLGVIYWHGKLIPAIDLASYFGITSATSANNHHLIATVSHDKSIIGFKFNDIAGVDAYQKEALDKSLVLNTRIKEKFIDGIHHGRVSILNIEEVVIDLSAELMKKGGVV